MKGMAARFAGAALAAAALVMAAAAFAKRGPVEEHSAPAAPVPAAAPATSAHRGEVLDPWSAAPGVAPKPVKLSKRAAARSGVVLDPWSSPAGVAAKPVVRPRARPRRTVPGTIADPWRKDRARSSKPKHQSPRRAPTPRTAPKLRRDSVVDPWR
jgi:hypothetical protein